MLTSTSLLLAPRKSLPRTPPAGAASSSCAFLRPLPPLSLAGGWPVPSFARSGSDGSVHGPQGTAHTNWTAPTTRQVMPTTTGARLPSAQSLLSEHMSPPLKSKMEAFPIRSAMNPNRRATQVIRHSAARMRRPKRTWKKVPFKGPCLVVWSGLYGDKRTDSSDGDSTQSAENAQAEHQLVLDCVRWLFWLGLGLQPFASERHGL